MWQSPRTRDRTGRALLWNGLRVATLDGLQVKVPDTVANREAFGSSGTADDSAAFPMARVVLAVARAGRSLLAATVDASRVGEQPLTARLVTQHPDLFTPSTSTCATATSTAPTSCRRSTAAVPARSWSYG